MAHGQIFKLCEEDIVSSAGNHQSRAGLTRNSQVIALWRKGKSSFIVSSVQADINAKMNTLRVALTSACTFDDVLVLFSSLFSGFSLLFSPVSLMVKSTTLRKPMTGIENPLSRFDCQLLPSATCLLWYPTSSPQLVLPGFRAFAGAGCKA